MCHDDAEVGDHVGGGRGASASSVGKIQDPKDKRGGARNPPQKVVLPSTLDFGCLAGIIYKLYWSTVLIEVKIKKKKPTQLDIDPQF